MKFYNLSIIILILFSSKIISSEIPTWNFSNISIDLLSSSSSYEYIIYNKKEFNTIITLKKIITKNMNLITTENYLTINTTTKKVLFENIDSFYINKLGYSIIICPKGNFHPYDFINEQEIIPEGFEANNEWDLKCYEHDTGYFMIFYLMNDNKNLFYYPDRDDKITKCQDCFYTYIYDFKLENGKRDKNYNYKFPIIKDEAGYMQYVPGTLLLNEEERRFGISAYQNIIEIIQSKSNTKANFDEENYFYFFTYNKISDFISGHSTVNFNLNDASSYILDYSKIIKNESSPFYFFKEENTEIKKINFISGTKYAYYQLYEKIENKFYYGIIDLYLNQIIYNFPEDNITFIPYSKTEMLTITSNSAYKICFAKKNNNLCARKCPYENLIIQQEGNFCVNECQNDEINLMPEDICIKTENCNISIYIINEEYNECGSCKFFYPLTTPYKFIQSTECISSIPDNAELYDEELYLLTCKNNYYLSNDKCLSILCNENCETCFELSSDDNDQKCASCKEGYILDENNNCKMKEISCDEGSFLNEEDNACYECTNLCKEYEQNKCSCSSCHNKYYVDPSTQRCRPCSKVCDIFIPNTCFCLSCPINYELYNRECIECTGCKIIGTSSCNCSVCLEGYYLENNKCIQCNKTCQSYKENLCECEDDNVSDNVNDIVNEYNYYGYYNEIDDEKILILKTENLTNLENNILEKIRNIFKNGDISISHLDNGNYFYVESKRAKFIISKSNDNTNKKINIDLSECEEKLKNETLLSNNVYLYMLYIELYETGINIPITEYELYYYKSDNNQFENLDLGICSDMKINKSVSINISKDDLDLYNSSSGYYNDICYTFTTKSGTDITLNDRRIEYVDNNMAVCEVDCDFIDYDYDYGKAICSCPISTSITQISDSEDEFDKEKLKSNFINFKNIANVQILKCYHLFFNSKFFKNIGCIIFFVIILIEFGNMLILLFYDYNLLFTKINDIFNFKFKNANKNYKKNSEWTEQNKNDIKIFDKQYKVNKTDYKSVKKKKRKNKKRKNKSSQKIKNSNKNFPPKKQMANTSKSSTKINLEKNNYNINNSKKRNKNQNREIKSINSNKYLNSLGFSENRKEDNIEINDKIMEYNDLELNLLPYLEASLVDKRNYCQYYGSLLRTKHILFFSFFNGDDHNSHMIKINLFFFTFAVSYTINALFFDDSTMHKIYEEEGKYNFIYQIPQILYSTIISSVILIIVKTLAIVEKNVLKIKNCEEGQEIKKVYKSQLKIIKIKFVCFFVIVYIFLLLFLYYVGCFCAVYKNTQIQLLTDTLISFLTSLLYPLAIYLIPGIFRISAINDKENKKACMYNFSKIIQLLI